MANYLKGNYEVKGDVDTPEKKSETASDAFEDAALRRLGGSIAYVARKKFLWQGEDESAEKPDSND